MGWSEVHTSIPTSLAARWDGCHKIYLLGDEAAVEEEQQIYGGRLPDHWIVITPDNHSEVLSTLHEWFDQSCELRFISHVVTTEFDPNAGFTSLIKQFEIDSD